MQLFISKCLDTYNFLMYLFPSQFRLSSLLSFFSHISQGDQNRKCVLLNPLLFVFKSIFFLLPLLLKTFFTLENMFSKSSLFLLSLFFNRLNFYHFPFLAFYCRFAVQQNGEKTIHLCKGCLLLNLIPIWTATFFFFLEVSCLSLIKKKGCAWCIASSLWSLLFDPINSAINVFSCSFRH